MMNSTSELISDYERAKHELEALISKNGDLNDVQVRTCDRQVDFTLKKLLETPLSTGPEIITRMRYLLKQIALQNNGCGITASMIELIEADLCKLAPDDECDLAYESSSSAVQNRDSLI